MSEEAKRPILIVDDEEDVATMLSFWAEKMWSYPAIRAGTGKDALEKLSERPCAVLLDIMLPDLSGVDVLKWIKLYDAHLPVIILSGQGSVETAVESLRSGAYDYFTKPIDRDRLHHTVLNAIKSYEMAQQVEKLEEMLHQKYTFDNIISADAKMQDVFNLMRKAVNSTITVTILGESGTGKELIARALHFNGPRKKGPFVVVNCAAIPRDLLESGLFGHEKGSFTGANDRKIGKFEIAAGGTLFLDEIGEMDLPLQAKILRAIQYKEFQRVGGTETIKVDTRIISATNRELVEMVKQNLFREDLYYRLATFPIFLPPLRQRRADILELADHFLKKFVNEGGKQVLHFSRDAVVALTRYDWPGNIRELESAIERAVLLTEGDTIELDSLPITVRGNISLEGEAGDRDTIKHFLDYLNHQQDLLPLTQLKKEYVQRAYALCDGNISQASKILKVSRATFYRIFDGQPEKEEEALPN